VSDLPEPPPQPPQLRASDADREHTADLLRHAAGEGRLDVDELDERLTAAYATRTRADLEKLVVDVVPDGTGLTPIAQPPGRMPVRPDGGKGSRNIIAIMGGADRKGHWRLSDRIGVLALMGGVDLDLNDAELSAKETTMTVWAIMGGGDIRVPDGLNVDVTSVPIMGGNDVQLGSERPDPGGPVLKLRLISIMGGVNVRRGRRKTRAERREEQRLRQARERGELPEPPSPPRHPWDHRR
jgi:hypothetical protein